jgi:hypothetical protein
MNVRIDLPRRPGKTPPPIPFDVPVDFDAVIIDCPDCGLVHFVTVDECPTPEQALREQRLAGLELATV